MDERTNNNLTPPQTITQVHNRFPQTYQAKVRDEEQTWIKDSFHALQYSLASQSSLRYNLRRIHVPFSPFSHSPSPHSLLGYLWP